MRKLTYLAFALGATGCASMSTLKTARSIDPGTYQVYASGGAVAVPTALVPASPGVPAGSQFEVGIRRGETANFDWGLKLSTWIGFELNATLSLVRSSVLDVALAPSVGLGELPFACTSTCPRSNNNVGLGELYAKVPLLLGLRFGHNGEHEVILGPEISPVALDVSQGVTQLPQWQGGLLVGGLFGVSFHLPGAIGFRVEPEVTVLVPANTFDLGPDAAQYLRFGARGAVLIQGALAFAVGDDGFQLPAEKPSPPPAPAPAARPNEPQSEPPPFIPLPVWPPLPVSPPPPPRERSDE